MQPTIITDFPHWILFICIMYISPYASQLREPERRQSCCRGRRTSPLCWSSCRALLRLRTPWPGADGSASPPPHTDGWYLDGAAFPCSISPGTAAFASSDRTWFCPRSWWPLCLWMTTKFQLQEFLIQKTFIFFYLWDLCIPTNFSMYKNCLVKQQ